MYMEITSRIREFYNAGFTFGYIREIIECEFNLSFEKANWYINEFRYCEGIA